jgi:hypothetical protein
MFISDGVGAPARPHRDGAYLRLSRNRLILLSFFILASWFVVFHFAATKRLPAASAPVASTSSPVTQSSIADGPWGELEVTPIDLEPPADAAERFASVDTSTWYFRDTDTAQLAQLLQTAGLSQDQRDGILQSSTPDASINGLVAKPDPAIVISLFPPARSAIYRVLAADPKNPQAEPFRHRPDPHDDWFADTGLSTEILTIARRLVYRRGDLEAFADVSALAPFLKTDADRAALYRALSAQSALLVRLHVRPKSDIPALVKYWGVGGRERQVGPLLESLSRLPNGNAINIIELLPEFARARALTFPALEGTSPNGRYDCHWTTFNFWSRIPDDDFTRSDYVASRINSGYHVVDKADQLGDAILFINAKGEGIHSATFIADDIVFTKNGSSMAAPWIFVNLADLLTYYETNGAVKKVILRKNSF